MKINEKNLCVFARAPPYDMEGFLNKRGEINRAFQRRYFVLKGNLLFYFETRIDKEPLGLIIVEGCTIELSVETDMDNYCFEIAFNGNRTYVLAADTQESMEAWMKALTCAGYEYKRIIVAELQRQLQEIEESRNKMRSNPAGITLSAETDTTEKPKPPPRRQNPFNRPAPPPPTTDADLQCGVVSPMPFITGYFGSSQAKADLDQRHSNHGLILQSTPKARRHGIGPSPSIFYNDNFTTSSQSGKLASITNVERMEQQIRLANAIEEFTRNHEQFRKNVMSDIIAYRERQSQPLIQF